MKKKQAIFTLVACSIAVLFLTGVLAVGLTDGNFGLANLRGGYAYEETENGYRYEYSWNTEENELTGLDVDWINGRVELKIGTESHVKIEETANRALGDEEKLQLSSSGGTLRIKWDNKFLNFSIFENRYKDLVVELPRSLAGKLELLECSTTSGNISVKGLAAERAEVQSTSGDLELSGLKGKYGSFSTTSGKIGLEDSSFEESLSVSTVSGSCDLSGNKGGAVSLNTVSGSLDYQGSAATLDANSISAPVFAELSTCPEQAGLHSVSGGLTLAIPENTGFEVDYSSISGTFSSDFPVEGGMGNSGRALYAKGKADFSFSTTSGDMRIQRKE